MDRIDVVRTAACAWPIERVPAHIVSKTIEELKETKNASERRVIQVHGEWPQMRAALKSGISEAPRYYVRVYRPEDQARDYYQDRPTPMEWLERAMLHGSGDDDSPSQTASGLRSGRDPPLKRDRPAANDEDEGSEPAAKRAKTAEEKETHRKVDQLLMEMLFPPVPKPEPFALMTPMHDSMRTWIKTNFLESKNLEVALVSVPKGLAEGASLVAVREWRDAQRDGRPPKNVDASDKLEIFVIPDTDPRVSLRGHKGVRATQTIPANVILLWYGGLLVWTQLPNTGVARDWSMNAYGYDSKTKDAHGHDLTVTAIEDHGTAAKYVNDCRRDPSDQDTSRANAMSGELTVNKHLPFIFLFSTKTIDKGEEVLIDYGSLYWKLFHARLEAHKQMCQRAFEMRTLLAGGTA